MNKFKVKILLGFFFATTVAFSQIGIGNTDPKSTLDITATNATGTTTNVDGLTIPKVTRERAQSMTAANIPTSTMIYVSEAITGTATGTTINVTAAGIYYWDGTAWQPVKSNTTGIKTTTTNLIMDISSTTAGNIDANQATNIGLYGFLTNAWTPATPTQKRTVGSYSDGVYFSSTTTATTLTNISLNGFLSNTGGGNGNVTIHIVKYSLGTTATVYTTTVTGTSLGTPLTFAINSGDIAPVTINILSTTNLAAGDVLVCVLVSNTGNNRVFEFTGQLQCTQ